MRTLFADTAYWFALFHSRDSLHAKALALSASLAGVQIVTSELVLVELLNLLAGAGAVSRRLGAQAVQQVRHSPTISVVPMSSAQFDAALVDYEARPDKSWSLTDCASFQIMRDAGIHEALTHDHHFQQAGFVALLRG